MKILQFYRETHFDKKDGYVYDIKILYPHKSLFLMSPMYEIQNNAQYCFEITIWKLIPLMIIYSLRNFHCKILYFMRILGLLKTKESEVLSLRDFTFKICKYRIKRYKFKA